MAGEKVYIADKETLDKIYNILAVDPIYGFIEHMNILSPTQRIEYIGLNKNFTPVSRNTNGSISLNDWAGFEILEANKPYMVRSDGTPDYRLQDNDYSKKYSDGSASDVANTSYDGGAFSWLQKIYKNETVVGDDRIVKFSLTKREGSSKSELVSEVSLILERLILSCCPSFCWMRSLGCLSKKMSTSIPSPALTSREIQPAHTWER